MCVIWGIPYLFIRVAVLEMSPTVIGYSVAPAIVVRYLAGVPSMGINAVALSVCALACAPAAVFAWPHTTPSAAAIGSVLVLAVVCTALGFICFFALIGEIGAVRATVITYVNPAVAAVLGIAVLNESLTFGMPVGFALVLVGSVLATRRPRLETASETPELALSGDPR
jgi:drug/metabolite transporter (DMT)-like permease